MDPHKIEFVFGYRDSAEIRLAQVDHRLEAINRLLDQGMRILDRIPPLEGEASHRYEAVIDSVEHPDRNVH